MSARHYSSANRVQGDAAILDRLSANRSYPETGLGENNGDLQEAHFWPAGSPSWPITSELPVIRAEPVFGCRRDHCVLAVLLENYARPPAGLHGNAAGARGIAEGSEELDVETGRGGAESDKRYRSRPSFGKSAWGRAVRPLQEPTSVKKIPRRGRFQHNSRLGVGLLDRLTNRPQERFRHKIYRCSSHLTSHWGEQWRSRRTVAASNRLWHFDALTI